MEGGSAVYNFPRHLVRPTVKQSRVGAGGKLTRLQHYFLRMQSLLDLPFLVGRNWKRSRSSLVVEVKCHLGIPLHGRKSGLIGSALGLELPDSARIRRNNVIE